MDHEPHQKIYVLFDPVSRLIKIGCSLYPHARCASLSNQLGRKLKLLYRHTVERDAFRIENSIHKKFSKHRKNGEWFEITAREAIKVILTYK